MRFLANLIFFFMNAKNKDGDMMKDKIIELLNKESIKLDELIEILGDEAKDTIEALIENKEIKYNKNTGKLSIYTGRMYITKEEIYNKVKENYFLREYEFYSLYKKCIKEARSCVNELIYEDKLIYDEFFEVYAIPFISKVNIKELVQDLLIMMS